MIAWSNCTLIVGELSRDGIVRHTNGVLPMAALVAREKGLDTLFVLVSDAAAKYRI